MRMRRESGVEACESAERALEEGVPRAERAAIEYTSTNTITFILSYSSKPLSFELGNFSTITGLNYNENYDALPPMETVKAALETLGLADEKNLQFTPYELINKSSLRIEEYLITYLMREREVFLEREWLDEQR
ncbi:hypothetical protein Tco_1136109 [Tanacetum coccineum]